ncbi:MAG: triose-phosphate isomerase [Candidatus Thermoplasmatota archaeon]|nr:triose-phosphate isomerase [Candidatus Thermoplasmatota archaeon]MCL5437617.1 triose-phosphate isomerase [Candidatus Thermoplasmatota archaeon]
MEERFLLVNFKQYERSTLKQGEKLLEKFSEITVKGGAFVGYSLPAYDIRLAEKFRGMNILAQHVDPVPAGAFTGKISMDALTQLGIRGSLLNHSERRLDPEVIENTLRLAKEKGIRIFLCVENAEEAEKYSRMGASFISYEPPELIGGDVSVSTARPSVIRDVVRVCTAHGSKVLVGAGIKNERDVKRSIELGASGILVASGIVLSESPAEKLGEFIKAMLAE